MGRADDERDMDSMVAELERKDAEVERLRAALELIAGGVMPISPNDENSLERFMGPSDMRSIARLALEQKATGEKQ